MLAFLYGQALAGGADYEKGVAFLRAGRADEALGLLVPLARGGSDDPYLYYHLGIAYYKTDHPAEAFEAFGRTQELAGGKAGDFGLSAAFSNLGIAYYRKKEYAEAEKCLARALAIDKDDGDGRYYLGLTRIAGKDYEGALSELAKAATLKAGDHKAQAAVSCAAGTAYTGLGRDGDALKAFAHALEEDPGNLDALYYTAVLNYKANGYQAAKPYFDAIMRGVKDSQDGRTKAALFTAFFNMGVDFQDRDQPGPAVEMFGRASSLNPDDADAHFYTGYNLAALERYEEAVTEFRQALAIDPQMARAKAQLEVSGRIASDKALGKAREAEGRGELYAALPLYMKAASLDPGNKAAKKALEQAERAVERDTKERAARARAYLTSGDYARAREASRELTRLNPADPVSTRLAGEVEAAVNKAADAEMARARSYEDSESLAEAESAYTRALEIRPGDARAKSALVRVKSVMEEFASALDKAKEALAADEFAKAGTYTARALELKPHDTDALAVKKRMSARMQELAQKAIREGDGYLDAGQKDRAAERFKAALALEPGNEHARRGLEKAQYVPPPVQAATPPPAPVAPAAPVNEAEVRRMYLTGVEHYTRGELNEAIASWREVLKMDPRNEKAASSIQKAEEKLKSSAGRTP